jgi:hypothetical protein
MGFNLAGIFVEQQDTFCLSRHPKHNEKKALEILESMNFGTELQNRAVQDLSQGLQPMPGQYFIGAYECGAVLSYHQLIQQVEESDVLAIEKRISTSYDIYPQNNSLAFGIFDTTNTYGYFFFENGRLIRALTGNINQNRVLDIGELLPEELLCFRRGKDRMIIDEFGQEMTAADGSGIIFELSKRFLGEPLNQFTGSMSLQLFE